MKRNTAPAARGAELGQFAGCSLCSFPHVSYKGWQEAQVLSRAVDLGPTEKRLQPGSGSELHPAVGVTSEQTERESVVLNMSLKILKKCKISILHVHMHRKPLTN